MTRILFLSIALLLLGSLVLFARELRLHAFNMRVTRAVAGLPTQTSSWHAFLQWVSTLGTRYRRFYSPENQEELRTAIQTAGFNPHRALPLLIGSKLLCMFLFPLVGALLSVFMTGSASHRLMFVGAALVIGIVAPRLAIKLIGRRFNAAVHRGTADAIDLLVICSEAGMGLESGLERVAQEMTRSNMAISKLLSALLDDLRVLPNRRDAFNNLGARCSVEGIRRFGIMINQSLQYGTPLADALRAIAIELRRDRITKLEERAAKLGAKLIMPMVIFMLPAMAVILAGSSLLHLTDAFGHH